MSKTLAFRITKHALQAGLLLGFFSSSPVWAMEQRQKEKFPKEQKLEQKCIEKVENLEDSLLRSLLCECCQDNLDSIKKVVLNLAEQENEKEKKLQEELEQELKKEKQGPGPQNKRRTPGMTKRQKRANRLLGLNQSLNEK